MRAVFFKDLKIDINEIVQIDGDSYNHLVKVCRVRIGEDVKILTGAGRSYICEVKEILKRELSLKVLSLEEAQRPYSIDIMLGLPKREAFELTLKNCTELGVQKLIPFIAKYSQWNIKNFDRIESLIESAMIQSNNPFLIEVNNPAQSIEDLKLEFSKYDLVVLTTLTNVNKEIPEKMTKQSKILIVIGPEGGLDQFEENLVLSLPNVATLNTGGPIMRTPNAVSTSVGFMLGKIAGL